jgi:hypothetical protein
MNLLQEPAVVAIGLLTAVRLAAVGGPWLDAPLANWNSSGAALAQAPAAEGNADPRCREQIRPPSGAEDRAVIAGGWTLVGPLQLFGDTSVVTATSGFDGMCRWWDYQVFVFSGGRFAGTLSPAPMRSRFDGAAVQVHLYRDSSITAEFVRYTDKDPLCCPSRTSVVSYRVEHPPEGPVVVPLTVGTAPAKTP